MATADSSSSSTLRFIGLFKQPVPGPTQDPDPDPLELHEGDVVWSFALSPSPSDSPPYPETSFHRHRHRFNSSKSGLSAALLDDEDRLIRRKSAAKAIPRQEDVVVAPEKHRHQSAPVNIPIWSKDFRRGNGNLDSIDEVEEMVPPHVIVARSHVTFSVFEGRGRTLKGRDLRRVRNAVFQQTGFID